MPLTEILVQKIIVHPLVLLSVVDHFYRMSKIGNKKRVVGILLGSWKSKGVLDVSNSFAVPFDEDEKDRNVWFFDHDYMENMRGMFKKVNPKERIVGWYHTGPNLHLNDIKINELIQRYCPHSVLVVIDVILQDLGLPTKAYIAVEEVPDDGSPITKTFEHVPTEIGAEEAEEVGVEHLLLDIKDTTVSSLSQKITSQLMGLKGLNARLNDIKSYIEKVGDGKMPINYQIVYQLQDIFNLLPDITKNQFTETMFMKTNDQMLVVYLAAMIRSIIALHNLINNKIKNRDAEEGKNDDSNNNAKSKTDYDNKSKLATKANPNDKAKENEELSDNNTDKGKQ